MKIFVSSGEVSGDLHLSYLVKNISKIDSSVKFYGVAGEHSKRAGVYITQDIKELAIMGFTEALKKYKFLKKKSEEYLKFIKDEKIEKVILVDYGGFNLKFLELLKKELPEVEVFFYIPPKLWIWGEKRIEKLRLADHIMVIFPWEVEFYKKHNIDAIYFGNPFSEKYSLIDRIEDKILLLPGSRKQEIKSLLPIMLEVVKKNPTEKYLLKLSSEKHLEWINDNLENYTNLEIDCNIDLLEAVKKSKVAIAASGTVTLELALMGLPTVVIYKTGAINYFIAKYILKVGYVSLPNLTINDEVFPELLQNDCEAEKIDIAVKNILENKIEVENKLRVVRQKLSGENITENFAKFLLKGKK
ncbi:MAG: lipid-A-disaccharide synthase [Cetobacterium sp.]|uniref:lipid-A-disaccharide synthase n=1 Tax=unclassified Cetobacterium TaxID=2630983 RepID=UPI00163CCB3A|nr:lipid-A-disaccharide synthase [Cetobacterium sp. 2A]MBC2856535.1 lipid-A-disaccharide synthase [Cetobacterium sp. 2A]